MNTKTPSPLFPSFYSLDDLKTNIFLFFSSTASEFLTMTRPAGKISCSENSFKTKNLWLLYNNNRGLGKQ